jgi:plastocyanin
MHRRQGDRRQGGTASWRPAWWLALLLVGAATVGAGLSVGTGTAAAQQKAAPVTVAIQVLSFVPQDITVSVGTRVAWVNDGGRHQIVADDGAFKSQQLTTAQQKFVYQFRRPGVFPYHCYFHGGAGGKGMAGVVTVVERTP